MPLLRCLPYSLLLLASSLSNVAWAEENWGLCQALSFTPIEAISSDVTDATEIESNFMFRQTNDVVNFGGQVKLTRPALSLTADRLSLNNETDQVKASGNVTFESPDYRLQTESMTMNHRDQSAYFASSSFTLPEQHIRGTANEVIQLKGSLSRYKDIQYTTCDPGNSTWHMTADQLDINQESGRGTAKHATVYIQDLPVLYLPYLQFPIDDRRMSGILTPTIGFSNTNGGSLSVPVYWNIAPNMDATITPAWYADRGLQLNTENRYLFRNHAGQIELSHLDDDKENDSRWFQKWVHKADLGSNITADITWREVSDSTFFDDFDSLGDSTDDVVHLERHVTLNHLVELWQSSLLFQAYQTPDPNLAVASGPYRRLPRLTVNSRFKTFDNGIQFNTSNEWVRFDHESNSNVVGDRTHLLTYLSWEQSDSGYFFKSKLEYALSDYQLDKNSLGANSIQRDIPILSLDTGLFFDREMSIRTDWTQTLEPRLYFLHTPYMDQSNIPVFDSAVLSDTYDNFFESNRFNGSDRIGDANQVSLGIGTRILDSNSGAELLYSRIGQIFYADDRRVQISGNTPQTDSKSNIISETTIRPNQNLLINTKLVYQPTTKKLSQKTLSVQHLHDGFAANLDYFFSDTVLEQAAVSMVYPINPRWMMVAKYSKSILQDKPIENLFGVNYESCCWGIKILVSQTSNDTFTKTDNAVFFEFTLEGLGQSGRILDSQLTNAIPGYNPNF
ncbi:MAG: LPS-assembly protein [Flavobacteriales bacterium]